MKRKIAALILSTFLLTGCSSQVNIGYVDGGKIMSDSPQIKSILEEGARKVEEVEREAETEFENNPEWTDEERDKARADIQRKLLGINQAYTTQLKYKLDEALSAIAQEKQLDVVIDSSETQPVILQGGVDVTAEVIQKLQ